MTGHRLAVVVAVISLIVGWSLLAYTVFGPTYSVLETQVARDGISSSREFSQSLLDVGLRPRTAVVLVAIGFAYLLVAAGAVLNARGVAVGRWLMLFAIVPVVAVNAISFGLAGLVPATILAAVATAMAWISRSPSAPRLVGEGASGAQPGPS